MAAPSLAAGTVRGIQTFVYDGFDDVGRSGKTVKNLLDEGAGHKY